MGWQSALGKVEELSHEFYNLGHMIEGTIAHYQATGQRNFLILQFAMQIVSVGR